MDRFEAIRTLIAAVDGGSLSAASRALNAPLPTVSRRVSDLEAHLGVQLVVRTPRQLHLTEVGEAYVAAARRALEELDEAERAASGEYRSPRGSLLLTAPMMFGKLHVAPVVHEFLRAYGEVNVRLVLTDSVMDIAGAHIDAAIRIGNLPASALIVKHIGEVKWVCCASESYLTRRGEPKTPADLAGFECIAFDGPEPERDWEFAAPSGRQVVRINPRYSVNSADAVIAAALDGLGLACLMSYQAAQPIKDKLLRPVLAEWAPEPMAVQIVYSKRAIQPLKLRALIDFLAPRLRKKLSDLVP